MNRKKIHGGHLALALLASALSTGCGNGSTVSKTEEEQFRHPPTTPPAQAMQYAAKQQKASVGMNQTAAPK